MFRALAGTTVLLVLSFAGQPPAKVAVIIGALLLLTRWVRSQRVYAEIDWSLLLMFAGLIIIIAGAEHTFLLSGTVACNKSIQITSGVRPTGTLSDRQRPRILRNRKGSTRTFAAVVNSYDRTSSTS
jgi:hypothetical protein